MKICAWPCWQSLLVQLKLPSKGGGSAAMQRMRTTQGWLDRLDRVTFVDRLLLGAEFS